jgi:hypothetical protein
MQSVYDYIVEPLGGRYNNVKSVGDKELILNTEVYNHQYINREAKVLYTPRAFKSEIKPGDIVTLHHNVFRRWHDVKGKEKNSRSFFKEDQYFVGQDQIYLYKRNSNWKCVKGYCFVQPIKDNSDLNSNSERPYIGVVKYSDGTVNVGDLVGFDPISDFEFVVDGQRMYRVLSKFITIKYEYQGDEEEYNPSWAQSS